MYIFRIRMYRWICFVHIQIHSIFSLTLYCHTTASSLNWELNILLQWNKMLYHQYYTYIFHTQTHILISIRNICNIMYSLYRQRNYLLAFDFVWMNCASVTTLLCYCCWCCTSIYMRLYFDVFIYESIVCHFILYWTKILKLTEMNTMNTEKCPFFLSCLQYIKKNSHRFILF